MIFHPPMSPYIDGYWYLGSPYSKYQDGLFMASEMACKLAALLIRKGIPVLSPVAHGHAIAIAAGADMLDQQLWRATCRPLMAAAHGLIVGKLPGWEESTGLLDEIDSFRAMGKPVHYMEVT